MVVNVLPHHQRAARYSADDLANAESLANTRTAAEYVTKAMEMRGTKHQLKAPQSSYIKYDVFANQEEKTMVVSGHQGGRPGAGQAPAGQHEIDMDDRYEGRDDDDDDANGSSSSDGGGTTEPSSRYFISEQVTTHQHRPTAAPSTAPTIIKPPRTRARPHQYHGRQPSVVAPTASLLDRHPPVTTRSYEEDYEYSPRKPDYGTPHVTKESAGQEHQHQHSVYHSYSSFPSDNHHQQPSTPAPQPLQHHYPHDSYHPLPQPTELPKSEMIKHIQHSVLRYMQELEAQGRFTSTTTSTTSTTTPPPPPAVEIKTYYRIPAHHGGSSTSVSASAHEAINKYNFGMGRGKSTYPKSHSAGSVSSSLPMDYYRTPATDIDDSYFPPSYTTASSISGIESYPSTTMASITYHHQHHSGADSGGEISTPHIDLTFRSKARPKPIDLAALDVGQSWSHDAEPPAEKVYYRYPASSSASSSKPSKPLHFSPQTYHDINSMTYAASGNSKPSPTFHFGAEGGYESIGDAEQTPVKFRDESQTVVTYQEPASADELLNDVQQHYRSPIHIINGIPVANPYKFNVEQLK